MYIPTSKIECSSFVANLPQIRDVTKKCLDLVILRSKIMFPFYNKKILTIFSQFAHFLRDRFVKHGFFRSTLFLLDLSLHSAILIASILVSQSTAKVGIERASPFLFWCSLWIALGCGRYVFRCKCNCNCNCDPRLIPIACSLLLDPFLVWLIYFFLFLLSSYFLPFCAVLFLTLCFLMLVFWFQVLS